MKRKLIRQGVGGMTIYLPKKWVDEHRLENGAEVEVEPLESDLLISAKPMDFKASTSITLTHLTESSIRTLITNTYRSGYDTITVSFSDEKQFSMLKHVIKTRLIGFEITRHEQGKCIVENVTEPAEDQFETILRKYLYSIADLLETAQQRLEGAASLSDPEEIEERIQKYDNFCRRILSKRKLRIKNSEMLWTFLVSLMRGQRDIYHMIKLLPVKTGAATRKMLSETRAMFDLLKQAYVERDVSLLSEVHERHQKLFYGDGYALLEKTRAKETIVAYHLVSAMRNFYLANSPLGGYLV